MKYLWKFKPQTDDWHFFSPEELPQAGFQSVYAVSDAAAEQMVSEGSFSGYSGEVDGGEFLWVDADTEEALEQALYVVRSRGLSYQLWTTGNRGGHVGIRRNVESSSRVPLTDKDWVERNIPTADLKLYSPLHLFRRPGAVHQKTGLKKALVEDVPGTTLSLELVAPKEELLVSSGLSSMFDDPLILALCVPHFDGQRHDAFKTLARRTANTGKSLEFIIELLLDVNTLGHPWPEAKVISIAEWGYRAASRKAAVR